MPAPFHKKWSGYWEYDWCICYYMNVSKSMTWMINLDKYCITLLNIQDMTHSYRNRFGKHSFQHCYANYTHTARWILLSEREKLWLLDFEGQTKLRKCNWEGIWYVYNHFPVMRFPFVKPESSFALDRSFLNFSFQIEY